MLLKKLKDLFKPSKSSLRNVLKEALFDQFGDDFSIYEIYLTVYTNDYEIYQNMYYFNENYKTVTFYQDVGYNHEIKIISKNNIKSIEPQYEKKSVEEKNDIMFV